MSFPYWRMYWNSSRGAEINFNGSGFELNPDQIFLIPPNTPFSTSMGSGKKKVSGYSLEGGRVTSKLYHDEVFVKNSVMHLYIHFNLGMPYDFIKPAVYCVDVTSEIRAKVNEIIRYILKENRVFSLHVSLVINSLISTIVAHIPENDLNIISTDLRVLQVLKDIEENPTMDLANPALAEKAHMSPNSFVRLFKQEIGETPQNYVKRRRIEKAGSLLHHSNLTIDDIAQNTGFSNRYHFSRVFKQLTGVSPASFRKGYILG